MPLPPALDQLIRDASTPDASQRRQLAVQDAGPEWDQFFLHLHAQIRAELARRGYDVPDRLPTDPPPFVTEISPVPVKRHLLPYRPRQRQRTRPRIEIVEVVHVVNPCVPSR